MIYHGFTTKKTDFTGIFWGFNMVFLGSMAWKSKWQITRLELNVGFIIHFIAEKLVAIANMSYK